MAMLEVQDIHTYYGNIHALKGISLVVDEGEIVTLIGANGAGKTTTLRSISQLLKPRQGSIHLEGEDLFKYKAHEVVYKGVAMVPEGRGVFSRLTVEENLDMGAYSRQDKDAIAIDLEKVFELFPRLEGAPQPGSRHAFWWRATNAGDWPGDDDRPASSPFGRAFDGLGACVG